MGREGKRKSKFVEGGETGEVGEKDTERERKRESEDRDREQESEGLLHNKLFQI